MAENHSSISGACDKQSFRQEQRPIISSIHIQQSIQFTCEHVIHAVKYSFQIHNLLFLLYKNKFNTHS